MMKSKLLAASLLALSAVGVFAQSGPSASADDLLAAIKAVKDPQFDPSKRGDHVYMQQYLADRNAAAAERDAKILDFFKAYPSNAETPKLMDRRWMDMLSSARNVAGLTAITQDADSIVRSNPPEAIKESAIYWKSYAGMVGAEENNQGSAAMMAAIKPFTAAYPKDPRGARLLMGVAMETKDPADAKALFEQVVRTYPNEPSTGYAKGKLHQIDGLGKPFELSFDDAISGKHVSVQDMKGKVVIVDFWATWCGPCVGEMPRMKKLYADYHDKGLEYIGVSLDQPEAQGGLTALKNFVAKNDIPWPQYYQGNYWQSEFSTSWGINSIPCLFIIDKQGNLVDLEGREGTDKKVADLLAK